MKRSWSALVVGGLALSASSLVMSQERKLDAQPYQSGVQETRSTVIETKKRIESGSTDFRRSSLFIGANVNVGGGSRYGKVHEFVISEQGCVDYVIIANEDRFVAVPWSVTRFDPGQRVVILDIEQNQVQTIPTYTEWTAFTSPDYIGRVSTFFKVDVRTRDVQRDDRPKTKALVEPKAAAELKPATENVPSTDKKVETPKVIEKKPDVEKKLDDE